MNYNVADFRQRILGKVNVNPRESDTVLDLGCGSGADAKFFAGNASRVIGLDLTGDSNWLRPRKENLDFLVADGLHLPLADNAFDIVFEKDALHHMDRSGQSKALREMLRVTRAGGKVIVVEANRYEPVSYLHMVLVKGHDHLSRGCFRRMIASVSRDVRFVSVQSRVWPTHSGQLLALIHFVEDVLERIPLVRNLLNYNVAILEKTPEFVRRENG